MVVRTNLDPEDDFSNEPITYYEIVNYNDDPVIEFDDEISNCPVYSRTVFTNPDPEEDEDYITHRR